MKNKTKRILAVVLACTMLFNTTNATDLLTKDDVKSTDGYTSGNFTTGEVSKIDINVPDSYISVIDKAVKDQAKHAYENKFTMNDIKNKYYKTSIVNKGEALLTFETKEAAAFSGIYLYNKLVNFVNRAYAFFNELTKLKADTKGIKTTMPENVTKELRETIDKNTSENEWVKLVIELMNNEKELQKTGLTLSKRNAVIESVKENLTNSGVSKDNVEAIGESLKQGTAAFKQASITIVDKQWKNKGNKWTLPDMFLSDFGDPIYRGWVLARSGNVYTLGYVQDGYCVPNYNNNININLLYTDNDGTGHIQLVNGVNGTSQTKFSSPTDFRSIYKKAVETANSNGGIDNSKVQAAINKSMEVTPNAINYNSTTGSQNNVPTTTVKVKYKPISYKHGKDEPYSYADNKLYDDESEEINGTGWYLYSYYEDGTLNLAYLENGELQTNYNKSGTDYCAWTDEQGWGYVNLESMKNTWKDEDEFKKDMQDACSKEHESTMLDIQAFNDNPGSGGGGGSSVDTGAFFGKEGSIMNQTGAKNVNSSQEAKGQVGDMKLKGVTEGNRVTMQYKRTEHAEAVGEDTIVILPDTDFVFTWPKKFKLLNGNLDIKSRWIPTDKEVEEVIKAMYNKAPNGVDNLVTAFSAMNREAVEAKNEYLPSDLARIFGGDFYDVDAVVNPASLTAALFDCLKYDASSVNWTTTGPTNGWLTNESGEWVADYDLINMLVLKAFGEYIYYSCYTVNDSGDEGTVKLYLTRSIPEQYKEYKYSIFNSGIKLGSTPTFDEIIQFIYFLDEKYAPLRGERIDMSSVTDEDYQSKGIRDMSDAMEEATYYCDAQGFFSVDEIANNTGKQMTEELFALTSKRIYRVLNRNTNINTRIK